MHPTSALKISIWRLILISIASLPLLLATQGRAQIESMILEPVSESEFHELFGIRSLDLLVQKEESVTHR